MLTTNRQHVKTMKRGRTGKDPDADQTFLWRICHALDEQPRFLAALIGVHYEKDFAPLLGEAYKLADIDRNDTWQRIAEHVDEKIGLLMAIKHELNRALHEDRTRRIARMERVKRVLPTPRK